MYFHSRREFLQSSALLLAAAIFNYSFAVKNKKPLLAFSTLGCPDWTFEQIINFASSHGYSGIEVRGIQRQLDLTKCSAFNTVENIKATIKLMEDKNLRFVDLGSSCTLHFAAGAERSKNLDEGKRFIDLAQQITCPYIRVFPNSFPKEQTKEVTIELIANGLLELAEHAKGSNVSVLIESHGDLVKISDLETVMNAAAHAHVGMVWDITNMWVVTKEQPLEMYTRLKKYIRHTHIKDAKLVEGKPQYTLLGKGEVPIIQAIDILSKDGYSGYYSFEWEKLWHPEIAEPEIALADYINVMEQHFKM